MYDVAGAKKAVPAPDSGLCDGCRQGVCALSHLQKDLPDRRFINLAKGGRLEATGPYDCMQFWIVTKGTAASCTTFADGRRQIVGIEYTGDVVCGLMSAPSTQHWLEALEECEVCQFDLTRRANALRHDPEFLAATFAIVHRRLTVSQDRISMLGRLDSQERVLLFLAELVQRHTALDPMAPVTALSMSREDIADYLGLNAETVSRVLTRIKKSGLVKFLNRTEYVMPDFEAVRRRVPVEIPMPHGACNARILMEAFK
ncbi:Crp/Fnr family transcriptional regulator [Shimia abyssi]|uniref:CRP/FNR family transcriptional regulator n=1 Tax=Shimia abyssi TaxID=1662395 RepID=A0A2P8FG73_9RHOB|nr:Crp/Fnr family transcriptional regulator [Shimia abyssi]PSL20716.1 CRP/FNR family transcriptional regulator [Shimia abyssi]